MLVFQPDLDITLPDLAENNEVIICLDCSASMEGATFLEAKQIALYALSLVGKKQKINIVKFGTGYKELFSYPKYITSNNVPTEFIMSATPTMGNTDFWKTLRYLNLLYPSQGLRNILLISDGHLQNESLTLQLVKRNVRHTRLFSCGIGSTANRHILRTLSQYGAGVFEYFNSKSKHSWKKQVRFSNILFLVLCLYVEIISSYKSIDSNFCVFVNRKGPYKKATGLKVLHPSVIV
uniref:protein mono-ADP-ribosyltransferase PARP4-like n=1 Tax=Panthera onca TaxID=9690 RepID=UPI00295402C4|nr:protein mono-ADP-ribosyltransferase PARP4-like [Panthera onca]